MPIIYKFDILETLKEKGYTSYRLRKEKIMGERTIQQLRNNQLVSWEIVSRLCELLHCQPGDLVAYAPDDQHPEGIS